jgi:hypothetical protein
MLNR